MTVTIETLLRGGQTSLVSLTGPEVDAVIQRVRAAGGRVADLNGPADKAGVLTALAAELAFPAWWGRNWDALEELLRHPDDGRQGPDVIVWRDSARLGDAEASAWATATEILRGAIDVRRGSGSPLIVILTGEQPSARAAEDTMSHAPDPSEHIPESVRKLGKVHHVAVVVREIEASLRLWRDTLGLPVELVLPIEQDRVTIAFLTVGESKIELVQPDDDTTGVARFLANKGEGFHHVCFEVADINAALMRLEMDGIELIDTAARKGAEGPVAFLHPRSCQGVLVELIEAPGGPAWAALGY